MSDQFEKISELAFWKSTVDIAPISGGITNHNYLVTDRGCKYFVRLGEDIPIHGVKRFNELAASEAAHKVGISPAVLYSEAGVMVLEYIEGAALSTKDVRGEKNLSRIIDLIKTCHTDIPKVFKGPALVFWVFQVLRDYANTLRDCKSHWIDDLTKLQDHAQSLERDVGEISLVFGHNDLLSGNVIDDGRRLWLIDWDYAGFNSPLFDLGGLSSNNAFNEQHEAFLLEHYYSKTPDKTLYKQFSAMKCASLLRETLWSMVSEHHSEINFDFNKYTQDNLKQFQQAWQQHQRDYP